MNQMEDNVTSDQKEGNEDLLGSACHMSQASPDWESLKLCRSVEALSVLTSCFLCDYRAKGLFT